MKIREAKDSSGRTLEEFWEGANGAREKLRKRIEEEKRRLDPNDPDRYWGPAQQQVKKLIEDLEIIEADLDRELTGIPGIWNNEIR